MKTRDNSLWRDRKRIWCGLPWTFTIYELTDNRLFIERGFLNKQYDEVRLYRILDVGLSRSLIQRMFGLGTIRVQSSDKSMNDFELKNIKKSQDVIEVLSKQVEEERMSHRIMGREIMTDFDGEDDYEEN